MMTTYEEILKQMSNEALLEEHRMFSISAWEDPDNIGHDSNMFQIQQELLSRMIPDELR
jgi:hypothetical protein